MAQYGVDRTDNPVVSGSASEGLTALGVSAFIQTLLDDADAATARATLDVDQAGTAIAMAIALG